jgi:RNA polymerase sigma-70 factor (ECF subfamily)
MSDELALFEAERGRLRAVAYRMLGSTADADDVVQEVWLRWDRLGPDGRAVVERPAAWFTTTASRLALDRLKSAQHRREQYVGPWLPEPILTDDDPADSVELAESLTLGFLAVLERLGPVERAVFLLAEVFDEPYADIAGVVGRSEEACRQIASRARRRVRDGRRHPVAPATSGEELLQAFVAACADGSIDEFRRVLTEDVVLVSDGGPKVHAARRPVRGVDRVGRLLGNLVKRVPSGAVLEFHRVNGEPGLLVRRNGAPWYVVALEADGDRVRSIHLVINPDKLERIGAGHGL